METRLGKVGKTRVKRNLEWWKGLAGPPEKGRDGSERMRRHEMRCDGLHSTEQGGMRWNITDQVGFNVME